MIQKKICMVGAFGVGKTSLVARFVFSIFSEKYQTTLGVKIDKKQLTVDGQEMTLMLWDLAGEDGITQVKPAYLRGAAGYILVADGCRAATLDAARDLQRRAAEAAGAVPYVLVVNKGDLREQWEVKEASLEELRAQGWQLRFTSAKTGDGVEELFLDLAAAMLKVDHA